MTDKEGIRKNIIRGLYALSLVSWGALGCLGYTYNEMHTELKETQKAVFIQSEQVFKLEKRVGDLSKLESVNEDKINKLEKQLDSDLGSEKTWTPMEVEISYYTASADECGNSDGITASGEVAQVGNTIAMGENIPFGTKVKIDDHIYTVEDRGNAIGSNSIDVLVATKEEAFSKGRQCKTVYILK